MATEINTGQASVKVDCKSSKIEISNRVLHLFIRKLREKLQCNGFHLRKMRRRVAIPKETIY